MKVSFSYQVMFQHEDVKRRIQNVGRHITSTYDDKQLVVLAIGQGGLVFAIDLIRQIDLPLQYHTVIVSSYGNEHSGGNINLKYFPQNVDFTNKRVIIVDDVCDKGNTIKYIRDYLIKQFQVDVNNIKTCTMVNNLSAQKAIDIDFYCFPSQGEWLVGYGLDEHQKYRNLKDIVKMNQGESK